MARSKRSSGRNSKRSSRRRRSMRRRRQSGGLLQMLGGGEKRDVHWQNFFDLVSLPLVNNIIHNDELKIILYLLLRLIQILRHSIFDESLILARIDVVIQSILTLDLLYSVYNRNKTGRIETNKLFGFNIGGKSKSISIEKTNWTWLVLLFIFSQLADNIRTLYYLFKANNIQDLSRSNFEKFEKMMKELDKMFSE